jgi:cytochrome c biogenesis protein CcmG/thiol:disulfide interchange protein DsbE
LNRYVLPIVFILFVAISWGGCSPLPATSDPAPDFVLELLDGGTVTLSDLKGQIVILDFWATWCGPCVEGLEHLQQVSTDYADQGVVVLAINFEDDRDEVSRFVQDHGLTFRILLDTHANVTDAYGVQGIPHQVVVNQEGVIHSIPLGSADLEHALRQLSQD